MSVVADLLFEREAFFLVEPIAFRAARITFVPHGGGERSHPIRRNLREAVERVPHGFPRTF